MWKCVFSAPEIVSGITRWGVFWRGVLVFLIGILVAMAPLLATFTLSVLFGWGLVAGGLWMLISAFRLEQWKWGWFFYSLLLTAGGVLLLMHPAAELLAFVWSVAIVILSGGVAGISICLAAHNSSRQNIFCFITSVCSILLGTLLFFCPVAGMTDLLWVLGILLAAEGFVLMIFAFWIPAKKRKMDQEQEESCPLTP